jgi:hypothetical protein
MDIYVHYRFNGHWHLWDSFDGIKTFEDDRFVDELNWTLSHAQKFVIQNGSLINTSTTSMPNSTGTINPPPVDGAWHLVNRTPDIIILQSTHHDVHNDLHMYRNILGDLFLKLKNVAPLPRIVWRGTLILPQTMNRLPYEAAALNLTRFHNIEYFNTTYWFHYFMNTLNGSYAISDFSSDGVHYGTISKWRDSRHILTLSEFLTQALVRQLCLP